jgi:hypothetical protein
MTRSKYDFGLFAQSNGPVTDYDMLVTSLPSLLYSPTISGELNLGCIVIYV